MAVVLDDQENVIEFLDEDLLEIEVTDVYGGYASLELQYKITDIERDKQLFKQGNKIFAENCLFIINSECSFDYIEKIIRVDAEEVIVELNNCTPFYIKDSFFAADVTGHTITVSRLFVQKVLQGFYNVKSTDLNSLEDIVLITVKGSMKKYDLLKKIESESGLMFKRNYYLKNNKIIKEIKLVKPSNYGTTHNSIVESVQIGENTNELTYSTDETRNALGVGVVLSENDSSNSTNTDVNYDKILEKFHNLDINNNISPTLYKYDFFREDIISVAEKIVFLVENQKHLPERISISHEEIFPETEKEELENSEPQNNKIYTVEIGMGQLLYLLAAAIENNCQNIPGNIELELIECASYSEDTRINTVFSVEEIFSLAEKTTAQCLASFKAPGDYSTRAGKISFQGLIYLFSKYLTTNQPVIFNTNNMSLLSKITPKFMQENIHYLTDYDNYESMPLFYTQNSAESSKIPVLESMAQVPGSVGYDLEKYISESYPVLVVKKRTNATEVGIEIESKGIADDAPEKNSIYFKSINLIENESEIKIDFKNKNIMLKKYVETTVEKEVTETVTTPNSGTITTTGKNTCGCCGYPKNPYKNYTKTWADYCPACGRKGTLVFNPKGVVDGEITCGNTGPACKTGGTKNGVKLSKGSIRGCDADYCCCCGGDKWGSRRCKSRKLTPAESSTSTTQKRTVTETQGEYKEITAENTGELNDSKISLSEVITPQSFFKAWYGDVSFKLKGCDFVSLDCDDTKQYEFSRFPYIKPRGELYIYSPPSKVDFNYIKTSNGNPKLEAFETSEQSVEEVLIGAWKKLNGNDGTVWLEKNEDISVQLVEKPGVQYCTGDFVYIKLPNSEVFKAQITEISYNPKLIGDKSIKIGNVRRESIR